MRVMESQGYRVQLDLRNQVLRLEIPEDRGYAPSHTSSSRGLGYAFGDEASVIPTLADLRASGFVSASVLAQKAKLFDDGLYAAVDLAAQRGEGTFRGKAHMLAALASRLAEGSDPAWPAPAIVLAGTVLGDPAVELPSHWQGPVQATLRPFLQDPIRSKPISFYTWSEALSCIFRQDRMLQTELECKAGIEAVVRAIWADPEIRSVYEGYLELVSRLTNPLAHPDLRTQFGDLEKGALQAPNDGIYFFPPSRAFETDLVKKLYANRPIPEGFNLADEMIKRIQSGEICLTPQESSGWYDYQTWALEPLVIPDQMPEAERLELDSSYRRQLIELFKGILALTRETHIKQLEIPWPGSAPGWEEPQVVIHVHPELSAEPLPTYYLRRGQSYHFIRQGLEDTFGPKALLTMHRMTASGPVELDLASELRQMEAVFYGAYMVTSEQLGMIPAASNLGSGTGPDDDATQFRQWVAQIQGDPDLGQDVRMMVPLFYDVLREKAKVWAFLGWATRPVKISFSRPPNWTVFDSKGKVVAGGGRRQGLFEGLLGRKAPRLEFVGRTETLAYPVAAEIYVDKILDRDEFRRLCDRYKTRSAILEALERVAEEGIGTAEMQEDGTT
jgi:hypothetical protein